MKSRTVIGVLFVVASLLKLATLWGQPIQHPVDCTPRHRLLASGMERHHPDTGLQGTECARGERCSHQFSRA